MTPSTAALERVEVRLGDGRTVRLFVKTLQSFALSPILEFVPPPQREDAIARFPWRVEAQVFAEVTLSPRSDFRPPKIHLIEGPDNLRARLWTEFVDQRPMSWDLDAYAAAARGLGRFAARHRDGQIVGEVPNPAMLAGYYHGRIANFALPRLHDPSFWRHPLVAEAVDDQLREDLRALEADVPAILRALDRLPQAFAHMDACPQNLLAPVSQADVLVAVDWGFASVQPIGADLAQLLAGRAESGELDPAELETVADTIERAFTDGLGDEGVGEPACRAAVPVAFLGTILVRSAFTALPIELLADDAPSAPNLPGLFRRRAAFGRFLLDRWAARRDTILGPLTS